MPQQLNVDSQLIVKDSNARQVDHTVNVYKRSIEEKALVIEEAQSMIRFYEGQLSSFNLLYQTSDPAYKAIIATRIVALEQRFKKICQDLRPIVPVYSPSLPMTEQLSSFLQAVTNNLGEDEDSDDEIEDEEYYSGNDE